MKARITLIVIGLILFSGAAIAQVPVVPVSIPLTLELGIGGGISLPNGTLRDHDDNGWNAGLQARFGGLLPLNIVGSVDRNSLPNKSSSYADIAWMLGAGFEYQVPSIIVSPYLGVEGLANLMSNSQEGSSSFARGGASVNLGVLFPIPAFGSFDASVRYQLFNLTGKEENEETISQVAARLALLFKTL